MKTNHATVSVASAGGVARLIGLAIMLGLCSVRLFGYASLSTWQTREAAVISSMNTSAFNYGYSATANSADLGWGGADILEGLHRMYELTGTTGYIATMSTYIDNAYNNLSVINGYEGWETSNYNSTTAEYAVHYGNILQEWARFILTVRANSTLAASLNPQGITYAAQANELESMINSDLVPSWEAYWSTQYNVLLNSWSDHTQSIPNNQFNAFGNALYLLAQVTPANAHYRLWADELSATFHTHVGNPVVTSSIASFNWAYWNDTTPSDTATATAEDYSHGYVDISAVATSYASGGLNNGRELYEFANTYYNVMWNGSTTAPLLTHLVDGTTPEEGYFIFNACDLQRWLPGIWPLAETYSSANWGTAPIYDATAVLEGATVLMLHPDNAAPAAFSTAVPAGGATGVNSLVNFSWTPSTNAADYTLQVATDSGFANLVISRPFIVGTNAAVPGLSHSTTYYWRVIARNAGGSTATTSSASFTTASASTYTLTFSHLDTRDTTALAGYHYMQALVDGVVVWQKDVAADGANTWFNESVDITSNCAGKSNVAVAFRLFENTGVGNYSVDVYFDDASITSADITNGGFEKSVLWYYSETNSGFTGGYSTAQAHSGTTSYKLSLPASTGTSTGQYASVQQEFELINPTKYMLNLYTKDDRSATASALQFKQVLINGTAVWSQDLATDPANAWLNAYVDIGHWVAGNSSVVVTLRLYHAGTISSYEATTYWDAVSITNTGLANGNFETGTDWAYAENLAAFVGAYSSTSPFSGAQCYSISFPSGTASATGNYGSIAQTVTVH